MNDVRKFYRRLNHAAYGLTELVAIGKDSRRISATGFYGNDDDFALAADSYNQACNVYAGRNPRPFSLSEKANGISGKKRAKDEDIRYLTAVSLDIDPIRKKDTPSTKEQHEAAIAFALNLQWGLGGCVDDSGNGAYLWISFIAPIRITRDNHRAIKSKCRLWQNLVKSKYNPEKYGLKFDGCYDFSRLKRVIGTFNHKAQRQSRIVKEGAPSDKIRGEILAIMVDENRERVSKPSLEILPSSCIPLSFRHLLKMDGYTRELWQTPDPLDDTSRHDWLLGLCCVEAGITSPEELTAILMNSPHGKYRRDGRRDYVERTVEKLVEQDRQ